jgi:hypothetical protein
MVASLSRGILRFFAFDQSDLLIISSAMPDTALG